MALFLVFGNEKCGHWGRVLRLGGGKMCRAGFRVWVGRRAEITIQARKTRPKCRVFRAWKEGGIRGLLVVVVSICIM